MAADNKPRGHVEVSYVEAAQEYLRSLPPEHFMEAVPQATQRKITVESMDLVHAQRPDIQTFNELLVQIQVPGRRKPEQVVPDNMVVVCDQQIKADGSYDVPLQPVGPFWVLEYVSKSSRRKDYDENFDKYEQIFKVPYYLAFYPENQELTLYRLRRSRYATGRPNAQGRYAIPELELEVGLLEGWVRFWFRGELLALPADLQNELLETRRQLAEERRQLTEERQRNAELTQQLEKVRQELENLRRQGGPEAPGS
jgi:Uma2 family endonuclease